MKKTQAKAESIDLKLWCEGCCIRIAPNEERAEFKGKWYHPRCKPTATSARAKNAPIA